MNILYHLKLVYRNFNNQRPYSVLNLLGLSIGLCITFISLLYVTQETGWDAFHKNSKNIYRLLAKGITGDEALMTMTTAFDAEELAEEIPEIKKVVRYTNSWPKINGINEKEAIYADPEIFEVFAFNIITGDLSSFKENLNTSVVSESYALKEFGTVDVIGKTISVDSRSLNREGNKITEHVIRAVYRDFPQKSLLQFSIIFPIGKSQIPERNTNVSYSAFRTFIELEENIDFEKTHLKFKEKKFGIQSLEDIHLYSDHLTGVENGGSIKVLFSYAVIGGLIFVISLMNFLLLYTAITKKRFKEFAIRKMVGLDKLSLLKMFIVESIIISLVSSIVAVLLVDLLLPFFNKFTNSHLVFSWFTNSRFLMYVLCVVMLISLLSGYKLYHYLIRYSTIEFIGVAKGNSSRNNFFLKNNALTIQLIIVCFMLIFSLGYYKQLDFLLKGDKGYQPQSVFVLSVNVDLIDTDVFIDEAKKYPEIIDVAQGPSIPNMRGSSISYINMLENSNHKVDMEHFRINDNYIPLYGISIKEGRNFSKQFSTDKKDAVLLNETAVKLLEIENPIGKKTNSGTIIGVVKDFNFENLHKMVRPIVFKMDNGNELVIKYNSEKKNESSLIVQKLLGNQNEYFKNIFNPNYSDLTLIDRYGSMEEARKNVLDPNYMDTVNEYFYGKEKTLQKTILLLTIIAIFITMLGLIGMSLFKNQQKTKEIGIRKVNGATITEIMLMLNRDFVKWVIIAFIIAVPVAYYVMSKWLENFAYKTNVSWWVYALAGMFTLVIALITVSWQTYKAATTNPVESLRNE
ncbi:ABC transporter permease [Confluentibacter sediminis]|uniref:ABC transporter permease n=1 Tax=Confluentibacter sediminis TaxID=2219045 RepID=UPI000DAD00DB|nr:ABC transporter permease [Confluentibacter sediminis]